MPTDHRQRLLTILARIDQDLAEAEALVRDPVDESNLPLASELRDLLAKMRAEVEQKLQC